MTTLKIKNLNVTSFAKIFAIYSFYTSILLAVIDLIVFAATNTSSLAAVASWGGWIVYIIVFIVLSPVAGYILGLIMSFIINLALRTGHDLELEVE